MDNQEFVIIEPTYMYGPEEARELKELKDGLLDAKGPIPFSYVNYKKCAEIILRYREMNGLGKLIHILPNPKLRKMKPLEFTLSNAHCPYEGIWFGRYMGMRNENHIWSPTSVTSSPRTLNLDVDSDLADWTVIRLFKNLYGSFYNKLTGDKPYLYVKDERAEMMAGLGSAESIVDTIDRVKSLNADMLLMVARQLGINLTPGMEKQIGSREVLGYVLKETIRDSKQVSEIIGNSAAAIYATISSAIYTGVILYDHNGFSYKGRFLGRTNEETITTLQSEPNTYQMISIQAKTADKLAIKIEKEMSQVLDIAPPDMDDEMVKPNSKF